MEPAILRMFSTEILFSDGAHLYWIPVQDALLPAFDQEVEEFVPVYLYVLYLGAAQEDYFFMLNEFQLEETSR